jgi:zinc protease
MKPTTILIIATLGMAALAPGQAPQAQPATSLTGVVRLHKVPVSNEVLKVKLPRPVERQLSNGIKLLVVESHRIPSISLQITIPSGNVRDGDIPGLADATAALIRLGTKTKNAKEIADAVSELGAGIGFGAGPDQGSISVSALTENFDAALGLLTDILMNPTFPQDELDKWKVRQRSQLEQMKANPGSLANDLLMKTLYPNDFRRMMRPTLESLNQITRDKIVEHYKTYYVPSGQWAGIAGDITPAAAAAKLEKALGAWKGGPVKRASFPLPAPIAEKKVYLIPRPNSVQTLLVVSNLALDRMSPDYIDVQVMNRVLGNGPSSRLFRNIREAKGYTYGISSGFNASRVLNYFQASTSVRTEVTEPALAELLKEFETIRDVPVPAEELADAKSATVAGFVLALENPASVLSRWLEQRDYGLPEDYWDTYTQKVEAVKAEDVQRVAKKYVPLGDAQIIAVGDAAKIAELLKKFGAVTLVAPDDK